MQTTPLHENDLNVGDTVFLKLNTSEEIHAEVTFVTNIGVFVRGRTNIILFGAIEAHSISRR